jgi:hypothetical protein
MANVFMPVMVVPDCGLKRQSLAHFVDKQEKYRGSRQRGERIRRVAIPRLSEIAIRRLPRRNRQTQPESPSASADRPASAVPSRRS